MELQSGVQLGSVANLLNGYQPGWNPGDPTGTPLFAPPNPLVNSYPADIPDNPATWSYPVITLHPTIQDLVSTLYAFSVVPLHDDASPPVFPSGPLTLNDADQAQALQTLGTALGLDVSDPSLSYMLVRLTRQVGTAQFSAHHGSVFVGRRRPTAHIQRGLQVALGRLRAGDVKLEPWMTGRLVVDDHPLADPTLADVADILTFFANYGTHYVSSITGGDVIYQVFAYQAERFQQLQQAYNSSPGQTSGPAAVGWDYYTTPVNGPYGFASAAGSVIAMSADTAFEQSVQAGQWNDPMFAHGNSVFHAYQDGTTLNLNDFTQVVPIALELSSLTNFAEPLPKDTLRRVFKAAMYQKYGDAITPAFEKPATYDYAAIFPQPQAGFVSTLATPSVDVYKQRLDLSDVQLMAPQEVTSFTLFTNVLELTGTAPLAVPGTAVTLVSHVVDVPDPLAGV
ncbi:MAG TPA: hypothetical protein VFJ82_14810, partial [Longimicrobium sp.]|nr:hypothetical protein [Longimicrobium sp.]